MLIVDDVISTGESSHAVEPVSYTHLDALNLSVGEGEFVSILGPSGCGKSTFLNILAGILPADGGSVLVDGKEVAGMSSHFAYMPQQDLLLPWKTILDNVCLYGKLHHRERQAKEQAMANMATFGLAGRCV